MNIIYPITISERTEFRSWDEVLDFVPTIDNWTYCDGSRYDEVLATVLCTDGHEENVAIGGYDGDASDFIPDWRGDGETVRKAIFRTEADGHTVKGVLIRDHYSCYNDPEEWDEELFIPAPRTTDWGKLRRRIEDRLRKDKKAVYVAASAIGIDFPMAE